MDRRSARAQWPMHNALKILAGSLLLWASSTSAGLQDPPASPAPPAKPAPPAAQPPPPDAPIFLGVLKEGETLRDQQVQRAAKRAAEEKAGLDAALQESINIAIRLGSFALRWLSAIIVVSLCGLIAAVLFTLFKGRHKELMGGKTSLRMKK